MKALKDTATLTGLVLLASAPAIAQGSLNFRDDFTGERLAPEFRLLNPDPDRMAMVDGEYVLLVTHRDIKNAVAYVGDVPETYAVIVRFGSIPSYKHQGVNLRIGEDDTYVSAGLFIDYNYGPRMYFLKQLNGEESNIQIDLEDDVIKPFYLRITKAGVEYGADYSFDGSTWSKIGAHVSVRPLARPTFSVYTSGDEAPESGIRVDSFEIVDLTNE